MRIDLKVGTHETGALGSAERTEAEKRSGQIGGGARGQGDSVRVSSEAQLLNSALKAAGDAPSVRADRVDEVRRKLEAGELGRDAGQLAERLIDDLLGK